MMTNALIVLVLVGGAALFAWLARRSLRLPHPAARWALAVVAALPALLLAVVTVFVAVGYTKFYLPRPRPALALDMASSAERIARGEHLARTTCMACHSSTGALPLSGGNDLQADLPLPLGTLYPPNLTPAGPLRDWSDAEIAQIIRNGLHKNGRMTLMPTAALRNLSDEDVAALVAFLRSQPPVQHETPPLSLTPLAAFLFGAGMAEAGAPPVQGQVVAPPRAPTAEYGAYVLSYQDCKSCHGDDLNGSQGGIGPASPSARAFIHAWTQEQFIETMRTGVDPGGHHIQPPMPWRMIGEMDDVELAALYQYIRAMP
jgi:mono/diheme cytochrome c family protein